MSEHVSSRRRNDYLWVRPTTIDMSTVPTSVLESLDKYIAEQFESVRNRHTSREWYVKKKLNDSLVENNRLQEELRRAYRDLNEARANLSTYENRDRMLDRTLQDSRALFAQGLTVLNTVTGPVVSPVTEPDTLGAARVHSEQHQPRLDYNEIEIDFNEGYDGSYQFTDINGGKYIVDIYYIHMYAYTHARVHTCIHVCRTTAVSRPPIVTRR